MAYPQAHGPKHLQAPGQSRFVPRAFVHGGLLHLELGGVTGHADVEATRHQWYYHDLRRPRSKEGTG